MKSFERWNMAALALRIEYHWWWILHWRKQGNRMIDKGVSFHSSALLDLSRRIDRHSLMANRYSKEYEKRFLPRPVTYQK
ncbi:MAG: hypothetical protein IKC03_07950 [Oscillospiraceae bacterium]|nr:hypothetical protein [Oscillospiraceae bacterium]